MGIVVEEIDETVLWLEPLAGAGIVPKARMESLTKEANELLAILPHPAKRRGPRRKSTNLQI
jgi:hypothetical protein